MNAVQEGGPNQQGERPVILLLEDDPGVRRSLQLVLQARGYVVRSFSSGKAVLADPAAKQAPCLIADYRLPELDGLAVQRQLRDTGWAGSAILITAFNSPSLEAQARAEGFSEVIEKPLLENALSSALARLVQQQPTTQAAITNH